ncbi:MAG: hypothetical protein ACD_3C00109G0005 [uncultured bacterium (gcode 4)]|uniref:Ankyrin repeat protein n=1 Tax=uncultured bacterium (gcode 4) TaxID=1234023 RepID=K2FA62_9BACT|nr:MAG: hypothetical protein ACD_3C00109G0005 [uncultured bacterium (gcode 4)]
MNWQNLDDIISQLAKPVEELAGDIWVAPENIWIYIENSITWKFSGLKWGVSSWVEALLEKDKEITPESEDGVMPVFNNLIRLLKSESLKNPWYEQYIDLLVSTMNVDATGESERTLLYFALHDWACNEDFIVEILKAWANPNLIVCGDTTLHFAIENWSENIVTALIKFWANPAKRDKSWISCLQLAKLAWNKKISHILENSKTFSFLQQNLHDILIAKWHDGWSQAIIYSKDMETELYWEKWIFWFANKDEDIMKAFIACWVDLNVRDDKKMTPIMNAAKYGKKEIVLALLEAWADKTLLDEQWKPAFMHAKLAWFDDIVKILEKCPVTDDFLNYLNSIWMSVVSDSIKEDRDIDAISDQGNTLLMYASMSWNFTLLNECKKFWADFNLTNSNWRTALTYAVAKESSDVVEFLLDNWADPNKKLMSWWTDNGAGIQVRERTCLDFTANTQIIRLIKQHKSFNWWFLSKVVNLLKK